MNLNPLSWFKRSQPANMTPEALWRLMADGVESSSGISVNSETAMRCAAVYACVRVLSESVAQLPLLVYREDAKGNKTRDKSHWLYRLLNVQPNAWQTAFEFREMLMGHLALRGKAFAFKSRLSSGRIAELIPLHPDCVTVKQNKDFTITYTYNGQALDAANVMHLRGLTLDGVEGVSPITYAREAVGISLAAEKTGARMFKNGVQARGMLKTPQGNLTPEQRKALSDAIAEAYGGADNAGKPMLLTGGMDWVNVGMTNQDAQYLETRKFQRSEICSIFRVPPHMIGDLERATFSNIEHQSLEFVSRTLLPWLRRFEQVITRDLIPEAEQSSVYVEHLADAMLRGDTLSRYQAYGQAIRDGWLSRNEVRAIENKNQAAGLDDYLLPLNMGEASDVTDPRTPATPATK